LNRADKYKREKEEIKRIYHFHKGRYGYRRITDEMKNLGYTINHKTVQKLMGVLDLKAKTRKIRYSSYKGEVGRIAENLLERNFKASLPNKKWVTDITQVKIQGENIYLSSLLDLFNGEVIAYSISKNPNTQLVKDMMSQAVDKVKDTKGLILHSDQGCQYQSQEFQQLLKKHGIIQSMSRKGNCLDNAPAESFFGIMKTELLYGTEFKTENEFMDALHQYIYYYNNLRIKARLKRKSPVQYRTLLLKI